MENLLYLFKPVAEVINIIGIVILIFGLTKELIKYVITEFKGGLRHTPVRNIQKIRYQLGLYTLLALDFLIVSDIILSIIDLTTDELIKLAVTIGLRITMGYFLGKEVDDIEEDQEKTN